MDDLNHGFGQLLGSNQCTQNGPTLRDILVRNNQRAQFQIESAKKLLDTLPTDVLDGPVNEFYRLIGY